VKNHIYCTVSPKNTRCFIITLASVNQFSKIFQIKIKSCLLIITSRRFMYSYKGSISPETRCYTTSLKFRIEECQKFWCHIHMNCCRVTGDKVKITLANINQVSKPSSDLQGNFYVYRLNISTPPVVCCYCIFWMLMLPIYHLDCHN